MAVGAARSFVDWWGRRAAMLRWLPVAGEMATLWFLSSRPLSLLGPGVVAAFAHNAMHVVAYGAMGGLGLMAVAGPLPARSRQLWLAILLAAGYGAIDEWHQSHVPGRIASIADLVADAAGAALGATLLQWLSTGHRAWAAGSLLAAAMSMLAVVLATCTDW